MVVTYTLTQDEENAVVAIVARINTQPVPTVQSYINARVQELFGKYVEQEQNLEANDIASQYQQATPGQKMAVRNALR